jgi:hypothetical protein
MDQIITQKNMAFKNIDLTYDFDDEDAFSINSYDSERMLSKLEKPRVSGVHVDEYDEMSEDEEYDEEVEDAQAQEVERAKYSKMLEGLSVLEGKLNWTSNWLEKIDTAGFSENPEYPTLGEQTTDHKRERVVEKRPIKYKPAQHINVVVGNSTSIGLKKPSPMPQQLKRKICKSVIYGTPCSYGEKCIFSHVQTENTQNPECKFGDNCKNKTCKFGHTSSAQSEIKPFKKMWLCRNMFKISAEKIEKINTCRFGENCIYAHSKDEISKAISNCKFGEKCNSVEINFTSSESNAKTRRYVNKKDSRQCLRLHPKERVTDFIRRTHYSTVV